jgi:hypothetical protein
MVVALVGANANELSPREKEQPLLLTRHVRRDQTNRMVDCIVGRRERYSHMYVLIKWTHFLITPFRNHVSEECDVTRNLSATSTETAQQTQQANEKPPTWQKDQTEGTLEMYGGLVGIYVHFSPRQRHRAIEYPYHCRSPAGGSFK